MYLEGMQRQTLELFDARWREVEFYATHWVREFSDDGGETKFSYHALSELRVRELLI